MNNFRSGIGRHGFRMGLLRRRLGDPFQRSRISKNPGHCVPTHYSENAKLANGFKPRCQYKLQQGKTSFMTPSVFRHWQTWVSSGAATGAVWELRLSELADYRKPRALQCSYELQRTPSWLHGSGTQRTQYKWRERRKESYITPPVSRHWKT
jgi:hypothetical protein